MKPPWRPLNKLTMSLLYTVRLHKHESVIARIAPASDTELRAEINAIGCSVILLAHAQPRLMQATRHMMTWLILAKQATKALLLG